MSEDGGHSIDVAAAGDGSAALPDEILKEEIDAIDRRRKNADRSTVENDLFGLALCRT